MLCQIEVHVICCSIFVSEQKWLVSNSLKNISCTLSHVESVVSGMIILVFGVFVFILFLLHLEEHVIFKLLIPFYNHFTLACVFKCSYSCLNTKCVMKQKTLK